MKKRSLWNRNFVLLALGQASSLMGNYTLKFALSMHVLERTGSASVFAGILAASLVPTIVLSPLGGVLADRVSRCALMIALDALSALAVLAASLMMPLGREELVTGALLVALAVLAAFESPAAQACVPQVLSGEDLVRGNAVVGQVGAVAGLIAPSLGAVFYAAAGIVPVMWAAAGCFAATALLECFLRLGRAAGEKPAHTTAAGDLREGVRFVCQKQPDIMRLLLLAALVSLFVAGTAVVGFPHLVRNVLGLSAQHYGAAESAMGAAAALGGAFVAAMAGRLRLRRLAAAFAGVGACLLLAGAAFALPLGAQARYAVLLAAFCACQFGCSVFSACAISAIQQRTPQRLMGKVMSFVFTLSLCAQPLGQLLYGALFDACGPDAHWVLLPSGAAVCAAGRASAGFFRRLEARP